MKIKNGEDKNNQVINVVKHDFKIGDRVRSCKYRNVFYKSDELLDTYNIYSD